MHELTIGLGLVAALLHGAAYLFYCIQSRLGQSRPNAASWGVWAFLTTLNAFSYSEMSGDVVASLQFFTGSVACLITFLYVLMIGRFSRLSTQEWSLLALGLVAVLVWWQLQNATGANLIVLGAFVISFIPTYQGVIRDPRIETPRPWILWTLAFLATTTNVVLRDSQWLGLLTPLVLLVAHAGIAVLSRGRKVQEWEQKKSR